MTPQVTAVATWRAAPDGSPRLVVPLASALSEKQRAMIDGGFTTVSQLTLKLPVTQADEARAADLPVFFGVRCSVKFDAWEETYDVARLDESPQTALVKRFDDYGELCLKGDVGGEALVARLAPAGGVILAFLVVKQTSVDEAAKIKEWLIQQQSGVMQSLFSHMLGELTLSQTTRVRVTVPPKPATLERGEREEQARDAAPAPAPVPAPEKIPSRSTSSASAKKPGKPAKGKPTATKRPRKSAPNAGREHDASKAPRSTVDGGRAPAAGGKP